MNITYVCLYYSLEIGLQVCKLVQLHALIWQSNGYGLHLLVILVFWIDVLGKPPDEEGVLEQVLVLPVPRNWIV